MNILQGPGYQTGYTKALAERCEVLRLACWYLPASTNDLNPPAADDSAAKLLTSSALRDRVSQHIESWLSQEETSAVEIEAGCWLLPVVLRKRRRVTAIVAGITFGAGVFDSAWFADLCQAAQIDPQQGREALAKYTWPGNVDLNLLTGAFEKAVEDHTQAESSAAIMDDFSEQLLETYEQTNLLFRLARYMNSLEDPKELIPTCCSQILPIFPFRWIAVKFWEQGHQVKGLTGRQFVTGELPCDSDEFEKAVIQQFSMNGEGDWTRLIEPGNGRVADLVGSEVIVETIKHDTEVVGVLMTGNKRGSCPMESDVTSGEMLFFEAASNMIGVFHENIARFEDLKDMFKGTLRALTAAIDAKDPYTRGHSERVAYLAARLAEKMGLDKPEVERVHTTGLVHDVGKIGVPGHVLSKPGRLTDEEFGLIKRHPSIGYEILKDIPALETMLPGVLHHHERWDGRGYPHGLAGEDIPMLGRILALADTFDAMSSTRSYRPALPRETVLNEIRDCAGTQFDPKLAPLFVELDLSEYDRLVEAHRSLSVFAA